MRIGVADPAIRTGAGAGIDGLEIERLEERLGHQQAPANGEWRMTNGEWRMANGEWRMANGERRTANGERRTANGERRTANGERRTVKVAQHPTVP